jgi:hypothetical protein
MVSRRQINFVNAEIDNVDVRLYFVASHTTDELIGAMERDVISTCPVCQGELHVTRLHCQTCGTTIEGQFQVGRFGRLSREQLALLESFLRARGNMRELERELGLSYPTIRGRIEALLRALGLADGDTAPAGAPSEPRSVIDPVARRDVLERLARHELTAEQAAAALRGEAEDETPATQSTDEQQPEDAR